MVSSGEAAHARQQTECLLERSHSMESEGHVPLRMHCDAFTYTHAGQSLWQAIVVWSQLLAVLGPFSFSSSSSAIVASLFLLRSAPLPFQWPIRSHRSVAPEVCSSVIVMYRSFRSTEEGAHPTPAQETFAVRNSLGA